MPCCKTVALHFWEGLGQKPNLVLPARAQVDKAVEYLEKASALDERDGVLYDIRVRRSDGATSSRGIYLREPLDSHCPVTCTIEVRPTVHEVPRIQTLCTSNHLNTSLCGGPPFNTQQPPNVCRRKYNISVYITLKGCCRKLSLWLQVDAGTLDPKEEPKDGQPDRQAVLVSALSC